MDALIIAAGYGSRLREISDAKPLTPVAGVPLLELGVRQAVSAGISRVVVVTGHQAIEIEKFLPSLSARVGIPVVSERVLHWSTPNGHSVIAGAAKISGDYLLMMADHIFEVSILTRLVREGTKSRGVTLAIDRRTDSPLIDPEDATWVRTDRDGRIDAIGKSIEQSVSALDMLLAGEMERALMKVHAKPPRPKPPKPGDTATLKDPT